MLPPKSRRGRRTRSGPGRLHRLLNTRRSDRLRATPLILLGRRLVIGRPGGSYRKKPYCGLRVGRRGPEGILSNERGDSSRCALSMPVFRRWSCGCASAKRMSRARRPLGCDTSSRPGRSARGRCQLRKRRAAISAPRSKSAGQVSPRNLTLWSTNHFLSAIRMTSRNGAYPETPSRSIVAHARIAACRTVARHSRLPADADVGPGAEPDRRSSRARAGLSVTGGEIPGMAVCPEDFAQICCPPRDLKKCDLDQRPVSKAGFLT